MTEDSRESGRPDSGVATVPGGDATLFFPLSLRTEETFSPQEIKVEYDDGGGTPAVLEIYDEPSNINQGDESDLVDRFYINSGDRLNPDMVYRDIEDDLVVTTDGNQDAEVTVTVGGYIVTG